MIANETKELQRFGIALMGTITWRESYKLYGKRSGTYELYGDTGVIGQYHDDYYFAECILCGEATKICPDQMLAVDEHYMHCAKEHNYVFPANKQFKVQDKQLQDLIRLGQEYNLPLPHLECSLDCIRQYIQLADGSQIVGCGVHKGNKAKTWMGAY